MFRTVCVRLRRKPHAVRFRSLLLAMTSGEPKSLIRSDCTPTFVRRVSTVRIEHLPEQILFRYRHEEVADEISNLHAPKLCLGYQLGDDVLSKRQFCCSLSPFVSQPHCDFKRPGLTTRARLMRHTGSRLRHRPESRILFGLFCCWMKRNSIVAAGNKPNQSLDVH